MDSGFAGVRGLGPARLKALVAQGIDSPRALLSTLPIGYRDTTHPVAIRALQSGQEAAVCGIITRPPSLHRANGRQWVSCTVADESGKLPCMWFGQPWVREHLHQGDEVLLCGRAVQKQRGIMLINPVIETEPSITPVYRAVAGLPAKTYRALVAEMLNQYLDDVTDPLPEGFRQRHRLAEKAWALRQAHQPTDLDSLVQAQRRLAFEELLLYQVALLDEKRRGTSGVRMPATEEDAEAFWALLPFPPTGAQRRVLGEIAADLAKAEPMARMVQGDVGCGKTALAFGALHMTVRHGWQGALMAPTEILAQQHYEGAKVLFEPLGIRVELLTGSMTPAERKRIRAALADGSCQVAIGTHALISEGVTFAKLGLVITDEQHRFGVRQRTKLAEKIDASAAAPNVLVLSATPIPRSLALVLYGDLDLSVVDELPPGRSPVQTRIVPEDKREGMYGFVRAQAAAGMQAYVVCPLVEDSEELEDCQSAEALFDALRKDSLKSLRIGLVHGQMSAADKDAVLAGFYAGELDVLVSTTVIEVGVNVPNATVMIIENAERFGLAQLHQLRGRVGRGSAQSWCFLMAAPSERLALMTQTQDGFVIAQKDLELRGAGELWGTRQHGKGGQGLLIGADAALLEETQRAAKALIAGDDSPEKRAILDVARSDFASKYGSVALN